MRFFLFLTTFVSFFLVSCSKNEKNRIETKDKIVQILTSHGIKRENIFFTDSINKENAIKFSSFQEFEKFVSQRKKIK